MREGREATLQVLFAGADLRGGRGVFRERDPEPGGHLLAAAVVRRRAEPATGDERAAFGEPLSHRPRQRPRAIAEHRQRVRRPAERREAAGQPVAVRVEHLAAKQLVPHREQAQGPRKLRGELQT
ncbi:hypothetical protein FJ251_08125 [bacterium]|nr:hypothetical protein [bacterium]